MNKDPKDVIIELILEQLLVRLGINEFSPGEFNSNADPKIRLDKMIKFTILSHIRELTSDYLKNGAKPEQIIETLRAFADFLDLYVQESDRLDKSGHS